MLNLLEKLCLANAPSGFEKEVRDIIIDEIKPHCNYISIDRSGNLLVFKKGKKTPSKRIMYSAHMDEVGMMISWIERDGYLRFNTLGGIDDKVLCGRRVTVGANRIPGVIASKPIHLIESDDRSKPTKADDMYIDIGTSTREESENLTQLGDYACFESDFYYFGTDNNLIKAKAIDDRAGCAVLCQLCKHDLEYDLHCAFTVCEEIGMRGAYTAAYAINPDIAMVLEGTTAADISGVPAHKQVCHLGEGVALSFMDKSTLYDPTLLELSKNTAKENGVKIQLKAYVSGGNDAGAINRTRDGVRMIAASAPVRYLHTASNVAHKDDIVSMYKFAKLMVGKLGEI